VLYIPSVPAEIPLTPAGSDSERGIGVGTSSPADRRFEFWSRILIDVSVRH
jgi:hypothetical protein